MQSVFRVNLREFEFLGLVDVNSHLSATVAHSKPVTLTRHAVSQPDVSQLHVGGARVVHAEHLCQFKWLLKSSSFCEQTRETMGDLSVLGCLL